MPTDNILSATDDFAESPWQNRLMDNVPPQCICVNYKIVMFYKTIDPGGSDMDDMMAVMQANLYAIMASMGWEFVDGSSGANSNNYGYDLDVNPTFTLGNGVYTANPGAGMYLPDGGNNMTYLCPSVAGYYSPEMGFTYFEATYPGGAPATFRACCYIIWTRFYVAELAWATDPIFQFGNALPVGANINYAGNLGGLNSPASASLVHAYYAAHGLNGIWSYPQTTDYPTPDQLVTAPPTRPCLPDVNGTPPGVFLAPPSMNNKGVIAIPVYNPATQITSTLHYYQEFYKLAPITAATTGAGGTTPAADEAGGAGGSGGGL